MNHTDIQLSDRGLKRRLKRQLLKNKQDFLAITNPGFEHILKSEIEALDGIEDIKIISGGIEFSGSIDLIYATNLYLRTANRVLMRISTFTARSYPELYNKCKRIGWELYNGFSDRLNISVSSRNSRLHHTDNIRSSVFEAISEYMEKLGVKVNMDDDSGITFYIRFFNDTCTVSIDSSGELLYKRGYRLKTGSAPIRESLASAILMEAQWNRFGVVMDPMCGSGVLILEAASMALCRAAGNNREFAIKNWPSFDMDKWLKYKEKAVKKQLSGTSTVFVASDVNSIAIHSAKENAELLSVGNIINFSQLDCLKIIPDSNSGLIVSNLPYGKRIEFTINELHSFFRSFGRHLKRYFTGWNYAFVVADPDFEKITGIPVEKTISFSNGGIPVRLVMGLIG